MEEIDKAPLPGRFFVEWKEPIPCFSLRKRCFPTTGGVLLAELDFQANFAEVIAYLKTSVGKFVFTKGVSKFTGAEMKAEHKNISAYNGAQNKEDKAICDLLKKEIDRALPKSESKIWHGSPVWFLDGNPVAGYHKLKNCVRILFWSGQTFEEAGLEPEGTFKAAEARYTTLKEVKVTPLRRWLSKSKKIQWDYKNIVKRKGALVRIE